ncbi:MAG: FAD-dependent oxidoreductase [Clostridiales bacterium]|nr:FAD-dependent oxidoreductase [Clostridiales bacterium]
MTTEPKIQQLMDDYGHWFDDDRWMELGRMTGRHTPYRELFTPMTVNRTTIKNRIVMAPMGNICMCEETGRPNQKMISYFIERAKGGAGLITSGLVPVSFGIDHSIIELDKLSYFPRIDRSRTVFAAWRDLAAGVHSYGSKFFIQLTPGLGRVGNPQCLINSLKFPVSASFNPNFYMAQVPCLRLSGHKLKKIIHNAGQAAADAHAAHIDGVYLHGHEGYLLEQLTNPAFNRRKLGHFADWQAFGIDMVKEIRHRVGDAYPIMYRIDLSLALNETYGDRMNSGDLKKFRNGRTIEMTLEYMKNLVDAGVDMFDVDLGCYDNWWLPHPPGAMPPGCFLEVSKIVKDYFAKHKIKSNAGQDVPVVGVGKLGYPDLAESALRDGLCDMVMLGRPLLADPQWPNKVYSGRVDEIIPCIGCQEGCLNEFVEGGHPQCAVNPRTAFEDVYPEQLTPAEQPKRIGVVGAGPAGVMLAVTAARRGHHVQLIEKSGRIGGRLIPGGVPKIKFDVENYRQYLERLVERTGGEYDLQFLPGVSADADWLQEQGYDAVVMAVGSSEFQLKLPGVEQANLVQATELLVKPELAATAKKVVVIGGGVVGCETAFWLRKELDKEVKLVEMTPHIMKGVCTANRGYLIHYLDEAGVDLLTCTRVTGFEKGGVQVMCNESTTVPDPTVTWHPILPENVENPLAPRLKVEEKPLTLPADLVVIAAGGRPDDALFLEAQRLHLADEVYNIGDSFHVGKVHEAVRSAYALALSL